MDARIFTRGARTPAHIATLTPMTWSAQLATGPQAFRRIDLHVTPLYGADLTTLTQANWRNIDALGEFVLTICPVATHSDNDTLAMARCVKTVIASLDPSLHITAVAIRNLLPASVLQYRAAHDASGLVAELKRVLYELDAHLSGRIDNGSLQRVVLARPNGTPIPEIERPRVREFFPALTGFYDVF